MNHYRITLPSGCSYTCDMNDAAVVSELRRGNTVTFLGPAKVVIVDDDGNVISDPWGLAS